MLGTEPASGADRASVTPAGGSITLPSESPSPGKELSLQARHVNRRSPGAPLLSTWGFDIP